MMENKDKILFIDTVNQEIDKIISYVDGFEISVEEVEKLEKENLVQLRTIATVQSIGSSTRIEGSQLSDIEINTLLKDLKITSLETRDEQEVVGYYEALEIIQESYAAMDLTENIKWT